MGLWFKRVKEWLVQRPDVGATGELKRLRVIEIGHRWIDRLSPFSAWLMIAYVLIMIELPLPERDHWNIFAIRLILAIQFLYVVTLEIISRTRARSYDRLGFQILRILANITLVSALIYFSSGAESHFWCLYVVPLFQANMYLRPRGIIAVYILTFVLYFLISSQRFTSPIPETFGFGLTNTLTLISVAVLLYLLLGAAQVGRAERRKDLARLELLNKVRSRMTYTRSLADNLMMILQEALDAIEADNGSIMISDPKTEQLEILAWIVNNEPRDCREHSRNDGIAGWVAKHRRPVNCKDTDKDDRFVRSEDRTIRSIISVPIITNEKLLCIINADAPEVNRFRDDDIELFSTLGAHVTTMIESLRLREAVLSLSSIPLDELYSKIAESAFTLIRGDIAILSLTDPADKIIRVAIYPQNEAEGLKSPRPDGLTNQILHSGEPQIILDAQNHPDVKPELKSRGVKSLIVVPLNADTANDESSTKALGVLFVCSKTKREFGESEKQILDSLADQAAKAIVQKRLREFQTSLLASAFDAIIAVDRKGNVKEFNAGAEKILGYSRDEVINTKVAKYYAEEKYAHEVLELLLDKKNNRKLINHPTYVKTKKDKLIPIILSASLLEDGSVGFFRDQSEIESIRETFQQLPGLITGEPSEFNNWTRVLESRAQGAMETLKAVAAWIYIYDHEKGEFQTPPTRYPIYGSNNRHEQLLAFARKLLNSEETVLVEMADDPKQFYCLAGGTLKVNNKTLGVMILDYGSPVEFDDNRLFLIRNYISDVANKLERDWERCEMMALLEGFYKTSLSLTTKVSFESLLQTILDFAVEATGAEYGALGIMSSPTRKIEPFLHSPFNPEFAARLKPPTGKGILGRLLGEDEVLNEENVEDNDYFTGFGSDEHPKIGSFLGASITLDGDPVGNIYVGNKKEASKFNKRDQRVLTILGTWAAGAWKSFRERQYATAKEAITVATVLLSRFAQLIGEERANVSTLLSELDVGERSDLDRHSLQRIAERVNRLDSQIEHTQKGLSKGSETVYLESIFSEIAKTRFNESGIKIDRKPGPPCLVRGNRFLLEWACNVLLDCAIRAQEKAGRTDGVVTVTCDIADRFVRCTITDVGGGVPKDIEPHLFKDMLDSQNGRNNSCFLVGWVLRVHKGGIAVTHTGPSGTTIDFWLPESSD